MEKVFKPKGTGKTGADNITTVPKLNNQLLNEVAGSAFTKNGTLKPEAQVGIPKFITIKTDNNIRAEHGLRLRGAY